MQLLPAHQVRVSVSVRGVVQGEPCRLPVRHWMERAESLARLVPTSSGRVRVPRWDDGMPPLTLERPLRAGPHVLRLAASSGVWRTQPGARTGAQPRLSYCIAPAWEFALPFEVADGTQEIALEVLVVDTGDVAVLELTVDHADEHALAGRRSFPSVTMGWRDRTGEARTAGLLAGAGTTTLTVFVDLDEVPDRALEIRSRVGSYEPQLVSTITLRPGTQRATVDVPSK